MIGMIVMKRVSRRTGVTNGDEITETTRVSGMTGMAGITRVTEMTRMSMNTLVS